MTTDIQKFLKMVDKTVDREKLTTTIGFLEHIVGSNQNPGCGGDRKMSEYQWTQMRDMVNLLKKFWALREEIPLECGEPQLADFTYDNHELDDDQELDDE